MKRITLIARVPIFSEDGKKIIQKAGDMVRTTRVLAQRLVTAGKHTYTTKSKLRSHLKRTTGTKAIPVVRS